MDVYTVYAGAYTNLFEHYCPKAIILEFPLGFSDLMISDGDPCFINLRQMKQVNYWAYLYAHVW